MKINELMKEEYIIKWANHIISKFGATIAIDFGTSREIICPCRTADWYCVLCPYSEVTTTSNSAMCLDGKRFSKLNYLKISAIKLKIMELLSSAV